MRVLPGLPHFGASAMRRCQAAAALGVAVLALGLALAPERAWAGVLMASWVLVCAGLAGAFFVALQYVTGARWSVALRRIPEAMTAALPVGAVGMAAVLLADPALYPWVGHPLAAEGWLGFKRAWLSRPFFEIRAAAYLAAWLALAAAIVRTSRGQDATGAPSATRRNVALSAAFLVVFAVTFWLASFDWIMSLEPDWYSTMFGVYNFAGLFLGGLAAIALLAIWLRRAGVLRGAVRPEHLQDVGTLVMAFSTFWMYVWFCQYLLIWYANVPEETAYYVRRAQGGWGVLFVATAALSWLLPFLLLLPRASKRDPRILGCASALVLAGRALDVYVMVAPPLSAGGPSLGPWELGAALAAGGLFGASFLHAFRGAAPVPVGDPYLPDSLGQNHA
jgi:hypothetical protein